MSTIRFAFALLSLSVTLVAPGFATEVSLRTNAPTGSELTFHNYNGGTSGSRIDFILHTDELTPTAASIIRTSYGGKYPSDHYPVTADFVLAVVPEPSSVALFMVGAIVLVFFRRRR